MTVSADGSGHRIKSLDVLRGAAIIGVIMVHIIFGAGREVDGVSNGFSVAELLYAGLPMFIIISGYLHKRGKDYMWNIKHRVVPIIIVLFMSIVILTSLMYGYLLILGYDLSQYNLLDDIMEILIGKCVFQTLGTATYNAGYVLAPYDISAGFYYLQIIAVGYLIFYAVADRVLDDWRKTVLTIASMIVITMLYLATINVQLPFSAQLGPIVAAFLLTGALLRNYRVAEYLENGYRQVKYWVIFLVAAVLGTLTIIYFPTGMTMYNSHFGDHGYWSVLTFYFFAMTCGTVLWYLAVFMIRVPIASDIFTFAGINSIIFYSQHMFIAKIMAAPFTTLTTDFWITVSSIGERSIILLLTLIIISAIILEIKRISGKMPEEDLDRQPSTHS